MDRLALSILCRALGVRLDVQEQQEDCHDPEMLRVLISLEYLARLQEDAMHLHARDGPRKRQRLRLSAAGGRYPMRRSKEPNNE